MEFVILVGYYPEIGFGSRNLDRSFEGILKEGSATKLGKLDELFRIEFSGEWPESRSRASGKNYGTNRIVHCIFF